MTKKKQKFRTSDAAKTNRQLIADWGALQKKWEPSAPISVTGGKFVSPKTQTRETNNAEIKSLRVWVTGTSSTKPNTRYTGDKMKGVGGMHKSNDIPIFDDEVAKDLAHMRR